MSLITIIIHFEVLTLEEKNLFLKSSQNFFDVMLRHLLSALETYSVILNMSVPSEIF